MSRALAYWPEMLAAGCLWLFVIWRFWRTLRTGHLPRQPGDTTRLAWQLWSVYFCIALAATFLWFTKILESPSALMISGRSLIAIAGYLLTAEVCYALAPELQRFRGSLLLLGGGVASSLIYLGSLGERFPLNLISLTLFEAYIFVMVVRVVAPAFWRSAQREGHLPMKLRLWTMWLTHAAVSLWMLNSLLHHLWTLWAWPYDEALLYHLALIVAVPSFLTGYLMPNVYFVKLAQGLEYLAHLCLVGQIRALEKTICGLLGRSPLALFPLWQAPQEKVYRLIISVFDQRKQLRQLEANALAQTIAQRLENVASPTLTYHHQQEALAAIACELRLTPLRLQIPMQFFRDAP